MFSILAIKELLKNKTVFVISLFSILCLTFYLYYTYSSNKIERIEESNRNLKIEIEDKIQYIEKLKFSYDTIVKSRSEIANSLRSANGEIDSLRDKLYRERKGKKSISELAEKKPKLIEKIINDAIAKTKLCFELVSANEECK